MRLIDSISFQRALCAIVGAVVGYLLWVAYYDLQLFPSSVVVALIHGMKSVTPWLGTENTRTFVLVLAVVSQALPGAILLGTTVGLFLPSLSAKRWLCYSVLAWPVLAYVASHLVLMQTGSNAEPNMVKLSLQMRGEHALVGLAIYSLFFVVMFLTYVLASRNKPHNPLFNTDARRVTPRAG
jgi:polyferredoxin